MFESNCAGVRWELYQPTALIKQLAVYEEYTQGNNMCMLFHFINTEFSFTVVAVVACAVTLMSTIILEWADKAYKF